MTEIIGSGLAFPLQVDRRGGIALARDEQDIDQAIQLILGTAPGERPMRPEFGCGVHDFVFDSIDANTVGTHGGRDPRRARPLGAADRRRRRSTSTSTQVGSGLLTIDIGYRVRATNTDAQPRLPVLRHPGGGDGVRLPEIQLDDRRFQDLVSEARTAHHARLPGVDRAQRLRPRHHADRAVRVDDGDDDLPAQPRAGQAPRGAAGPARHPPRRPERGAPRACASGSPTRRPSRS